MFDPTQPTPVSVEHISKEANPTTSGPKVKKPAKQKGSPTKSKPKKRTKVSSSSPKEDAHDIQVDSGRPKTPPAHSSEVPLNVSKSPAHTHGESPHNPPSPSQKGDVGVDHSSLHPPGTNPRVTYDDPIISSTHTHSGSFFSDTKLSRDGAISPTPEASLGLIPRRFTG